jgi:2'-5' RNA ligase
MRDDSLHLTLVFVGNVAETRLTELASLAGSFRGSAFTLTLDLTDCWAHNRIGCLTASQTPQPLLVLVRFLERGVIHLGLPLEQRPFHPHVTLVRNANCKNGNPALEPIRWVARDFVLVRSTLRANGARYEELGRWPLLG